MDLYLPADYLILREELDDWRDAPACRYAEAPHRKHDTDRQTDSADPNWKTF